MQRDAVHQDGSRLQLLETIFFEALERTPGLDREDYIARACRDDYALEDELRTLLASDEATWHRQDHAESLPRFGAYQAIGLLGRGGMGTVYLAERADGAFELKAAVKVVPLAIASDQLERRFRRERQILAALNHPNIARLLDGGLSELGLPYLVMEFIEGSPIDRYCEERQSSARDKIALVRSVCGGLSHAHAQGVIHRDLKPSNILVDRKGNVKLVDFGTASLLASGDGADTSSGVLAFTPDYASPEQVKMAPVGPASDVYSLGMILYRLVTGRAPYRITDYSPTAIAEVVCGTEPSRAGVDRKLDAVLARALQKDPIRRYASIEELDTDLAAYLEGHPVRADVAEVRSHRAIRVAGLLLLVAAAALVFFTRGSRSALVPTVLTPAGESWTGSSLAAGGNWLVYCKAAPQSGHTEVFLRDLRSNADRQVTNSPLAKSEPTVSAAGDFVAFRASAEEPQIQEINIATGEIRTLARGVGPSYSPDGRFILYHSVDVAPDATAAGRNRLFLIPARGGASHSSPQPVAANFDVIEDALWGPDSAHLLIRGIRRISERNYTDLWNVSLAGGTEPVTPLGGWASVGGLDTAAIPCWWNGANEVWKRENGELRRDVYTIAGAPGRATRTAPTIPLYTSDADITGCSADGRGTVLIQRETRSSQIWTIPLDPGTGLPAGPSRPFIARGAPDLAVSFSHDGALAAVSGMDLRIPLPLQVLNHKTGQTWNIERAGPGLLSGDGRTVLYYDWHSLKVARVGTPGAERMLPLSGVIWSVSSAARYILAFAAPADPRTISVRDLETGLASVILSDPARNLYLADFSFDDQWVVFDAAERDSPARVVAAPFRGMEPSPRKDWVDIARGSYPKWAPQGDGVYFLSGIDGYPCLYRQTVDARTKHPVGAPQAVQHFHGNLSPRWLVPGYFRLAVASDKLGFALGETRGSAVLLRK